MFSLLEEKFDKSDKCDKDGKRDRDDKSDKDYKSDKVDKDDGTWQRLARAQHEDFGQDQGIPAAGNN